MNANEFLHKKDVAYMNRLSTSLDFNAIISLMEEYAALRQPPVIGRSEQLTAFNEWLDDNHHGFKIPDMILQEYIRYGGQLFASPYNRRLAQCVLSTTKFQQNERK